MAIPPNDERTPLLPDSSHAHAVPDSDPFNVLQELILLTKRTIPICLSFALQNIVQASSAVIAGTLSPFDLEVVSYGFMFFSCTGTMIAIGGATALDTLCGQALTSADDPSVLGFLFQQCTLILVLIFAVLVTPIWIFSAQLFVALGQDKDFALETGRFMIWMLPAGLMQVLSECLKKFLQIQGASNEAGWATFAASVVGILTNFLLVKYSSLGRTAIALTFCLFQVLTIVLLLYSIYREPRVRKTWRTSCVGIFKGLGRVVFYAVTGILTIATEWWSFEILAMMAARLDKESIGAQSILMSSDLLFTTVSLGLSVAASHRIGNMLGANQGLRARKAAAVPYLLSLIIGLVEFVAIILAKDHYGRLFTSDRAVIRKTAQVLPLMAGFQVLDLSNGGAGGILRGAAQNHISGMCNFLGYYGVGLTTAWYLCFQRGLGLYGLWAGIISGSGALLLLQTAAILRIHWVELGSEVSKQHNA